MRASLRTDRRGRRALTAGLAVAAVGISVAGANAAAPSAHQTVAARVTAAAKTTAAEVRWDVDRVSGLTARRWTPARVLHAPVLRTLPTTTPTGTPTQGDPLAAVDMPVAGVFGPTSVWNQDVSSAPLAANSGAMIKDLVAHVTDRYGGIAAFNAHDYTTAFYTAPASTPSVDLAFDDCQGKGYTPSGLIGPGGQFTDVPIPSGAMPAAGTDHFLAVYSPSRDQLWEFWEAEHTSSGWSACWGGRIDHVSTAAGFFSGGYGASGSGLAVSAGTVELSEVRAGDIPHALSLAIPDTAAWPAMSYPAQRTDGGDPDSTAIPVGTRLRLDPSIDVDTLPGLTPIARIVAHAAQTYGFIVTDSSGAVSVTGESGSAESAVSGVDPWTALEGGLPDYLVLQGFPWGQLQALPQNWGEPAS